MYVHLSMEEDVLDNVVFPFHLLCLSTPSFIDVLHWFFLSSSLKYLARNSPSGKTKRAQL